MKLTELIAELQQFQEKYGEMDVEWEQATEFIDGNRIILWYAAGRVDEYTLIQAPTPETPVVEHKDGKVGSK